MGLGFFGSFGSFGCGSKLNDRGGGGANRRYWSMFPQGNPFWTSGFCEPRPFWGARPIQGLPLPPWKRVLHYQGGCLCIPPVEKGKPCAPFGEAARARQGPPLEVSEAQSLDGHHVSPHPCELLTGVGSASLSLGLKGLVFLFWGGDPTCCEFYIRNPMFFFGGWNWNPPFL